MNTDEREQGREARKRLPRSALGEWSIVDRDPTDLLVAACSGRIEKLLPIRWGRMSSSPFGFFRGSAALMAGDITSRHDTGIAAQICGDAHIRNVGAFSSPEGHLVFDINDFDETVRAPFEWDLLRFAASLRLGGKEAACLPRQLDAAVMAFSGSYRRAMERFASMAFIDLMRADVKRIVTERPTHRVLQKARRASRRRLLQKYAMPTRKGWRLQIRRPTTFRIAATERAAVVDSIDRYAGTLAPEHRLAVSRYRPVDVAFRVVGTGSVGTRDYVILCQGASADDVLFLQVKEAVPSAYEPHVGRQYEHDGRRVVEGQRLMQRASDPFLGWTDVDGRSFIVRQLSDHKASIQPTDVSGTALAQFADVAGEIFARAHARTGAASMIAGYVGRNDAFDRALARFAASYAAQTKQDHQHLVNAIRNKRLRAVME